MLDSSRSLLEHCIKDMYSAEKQLLTALPKMAKAAGGKRCEAMAGLIAEGH